MLAGILCISDLNTQPVALDGLSSAASAKQNMPTSQTDAPALAIPAAAIVFAMIRKSISPK